MKQLEKLSQYLPLDIISTLKDPSFWSKLNVLKYPSELKTTCSSPQIHKPRTFFDSNQLMYVTGQKFVSRLC